MTTDATKGDRRRRRRPGFTLLELLVVLAILGLIAAFAAPRVLQFLGGARSDAAAIQINNIAAALDLYRLEVGRYPSTEDGIAALVDRPADAPGWNGPYLDRVGGLSDPWGRVYHYRFPGEQGVYDLFSLGADGQQGGDGEDADISTWQ